MSTARGMLTRDELARDIEAGAIDTVALVATDLYGRFVGKRLDARFFLEQVVEDGSHACDYLFTVDMEMNPVAGYRFANWAKGYGDVHLDPDLASMRRASWLERTAIVIADVRDRDSHELVEIAPRSILRRQVRRAAEQGFVAQAASELEYYLYDDSYRAAASKGWRDLEPAGWYVEDYHLLQGTREEPFTGAVRRHLAASGVPVESSKGEWGLGQHELNVRYAEALAMADRHVVLKQCLKEVAEGLGRSVTFMAKVGEAQAGSSCHLHLSLWSGGCNAFDGDASLGSLRCSDAFRWFLGGWMARTRELMPFWAPTVNSYKRYQSASWAPTRIAWSRDNRTASFRIVGSGASLRIECRLPGADANPYLAFAAALAAGLDGIERRTEPPPEFRGDAYAARELEPVPTSLERAARELERSELARAAFGEQVVEHYLHFFRSEAAEAERAVTDWERRRYFERI